MEVAQKISSWISFHQFSVHQSVYLSLQPGQRVSGHHPVLDIWSRICWLFFFRSVDNVWLVTSSSSLILGMVCFIQNRQIKILFLALSFTAQVVALLVPVLVVCVILKKPRCQWSRLTGFSSSCQRLYHHWLVFFYLSGHRRMVFTGCLLSFPHRYYLSWTLLLVLLVVECELTVMIVWILQLFRFHQISL